MIDIKGLTIKKIHKHLIDGDFTVKELCDVYINNIKEKDGEVHAFLEVFDESTITAQVERAQMMIDNERADNQASDKTPSAAKAQKGPGGEFFLAGIPIAIKDNILIEGKKASAASKILENYVASYSGQAIKKLQDAGAVFVGRTNMDEFAMGSSTENSAYGPTKNPHDLSRVPGGSSGGSAAAVAMDGALIALGSDTAGSVRQPAAFCGCVGLKTTYGSISRNGLIALGSSLDQIGPITKSVEDSEIIFNIMRGQDPLDSTTIADVEFKKLESKARLDEKSLNIGVPRSLIEGGNGKASENGSGIDADVLKNFEEAIERLKSLGHKIVDIELPHAKYSLPAYYIMLPGEASSNLSRFDGMKYGLYTAGDKLIDDYLLTRGAGFGPEPRRRILLGTYVLSSGYYDSYYNKSQQVRNLITKDFLDAWEKVDLIITPTTPTPAFKLGEKTQDPVSMYLADVFTVPSNIANIPTISVPSGTVAREDKNLPLGIQFFAPHCQENLLFRIGKEFAGE